MIDDPRASQIAAMRKDYMRRGLDEKDLDPDPLKQFAAWFQEALDSRIIAEPNAMILSTVSPEGQPRGRFVLLKGLDPAGFIFFTNFESAKGRDLAGKILAPHSPSDGSNLERQVCIEGKTTPTPRTAVEAYFQTRPRGSRLGAWASPQSQVIPDRDYLTARLADAERRFPGDGDVAPPPNWGGYLLTPERIEFWQGRTNRLHDRLRYRKDGAAWIIERLAP